MNKTKVLSNKVVSTYLEQIVEDVKISNKEIKKRRLVRDMKELSDILQSYMTDMHIKYSYGIGTLAEVPWIIISNPEITKGASKGYYIVILFDSKEKNIVIELAYAWTPFKNKYKTKHGLNAAIAAASKTRELLDKKFDTNNFDNSIRDIGDGILARGYGAGRIVGKMIKKDNLASFDFNKIYEQLKKYYDYLQNNLLGGLNIEDVLLESDQKGINIKDATDKVEKRYLDDIVISSYDGYKHAEKAILNSKKNTIIARDSHKKSRENQSRVGEQGEQIVLKYEKLNVSNYQPKILDTDGDGYDILSYENNGDEKYIEVKSTVKNASKITFHISQNELDRARELNNYYLYIVTNVGSSNPSIFKFKKPFGCKVQQQWEGFELVATKYSVTIQLKI